MEDYASSSKNIVTVGPDTVSSRSRNKSADPPMSFTKREVAKTATRLKTGSAPNPRSPAEPKDRPSRKLEKQGPEIIRGFFGFAPGFKLSA